MHAAGHMVEGSISACHTCGAHVPLRSQHLSIDESVVRVYCSDGCKADAERADAPTGAGAAVFAGKLLLIGVGLASLSPVGAPAGSFAAALIARTERVIERPDPSPAAESLPLYGPWPPTERERAEQFFAAAAGERWVHPLAGPVRQLPIRPSRAFGAPRHGDRPAECRSGHCGVDIGERWGDPVYAAADGVVERVERRAGRSGGRYVRLAHRDGSIVTGYFHLAAIPRRLKPGGSVFAGEIIGVLGDTGIEHSGPHLHFAIAVRPGSDHRREVYIDPEPLIALWPLRVARGDGTVAVSTAPGVPQGAAGSRAR